MQALLSFWSMPTRVFGGIAALGLSLLLSACGRSPSVSPLVKEVRSELSLAQVAAAEAELTRRDTPAVRRRMADACDATVDHAGAALALFPLVPSGDDRLREEFINHCLAISWLDEANSVYRTLPSPSPAVTLQLARGYARHGERRQAAQLLETLTPQAKLADNWLGGATLWLQLRQPEQAIQWAEHGVTQSADGREATLLLARCLFAAGHYRQLIKRLQDAGITEEPAAEFWIGRALLRSNSPNDRQQGIERLSRFTADHTDQAVAAFDLGRALLETGKPAPATRFLTQAMEADYQSVLCYPLLARAYAQLGMRRESCWAQGRACLFRGDFSGAQVQFRTSLEIDPSKPAAYLDLAKAYAADLKPQQALAVLERAQKTIPGNLEISLLKASLLGRLERVQEEITELENATALSVQRANEPLGELGKLYYGSQQYDRAIVTLKRAVQLESGDALSHFYLGLCYSRRTENPADATLAVTHLLHTAHAQPDYHYPWINAGSVLLRLNHLSEAAACFRRAIDGDSRWDGPYFSLAQTLQRQNRPQERALLLRLYARARRLEAERSRLEVEAGRRPRDARVRFAMGDRMLRDGRAREAFDELYQAVALRPGWKEAEVRYADACSLLEYEDLQREAELAAR